MIQQPDNLDLHLLKALQRSKNNSRNFQQSWLDVSLNTQNQYLSTRQDMFRSGDSQRILKRKQGLLTQIRAQTTELKQMISIPSDAHLLHKLEQKRMVYQMEAVVHKVLDSSVQRQKVKANALRLTSALGVIPKQAVQVLQSRNSRMRNTPLNRTLNLTPNEVTRCPLSTVERSCSQLS